MNELREFIEAKVKILSEKTEEDSMDILVPWIQANKRNQNKRIYKLDLLQREVARIQSSVKKGSFVGTGDHPAGGLADVATASHIVKKVWLDEKGIGMAEMRIIGTERGKSIMTLIRNNAQLGVSARGFGNISPTGFVEDDYRLMGIDIVLNPSYKGAVFDKGNICESQNFEEQQDDTIVDREEALHDLLSTSYSKAINDGMWYGDFESYCELHEKGLRATLLLPEKDGKTSVQKLTEEQIKRRILSHYDEALKAGFRGTLSEWKDKFPKLVEMAGKSIKISEQKIEKKESFVGDVRFYYNEAIKAGFKGTIEKFKEEHPELVAEDYEEKLAEEVKRKKPETLEQEATRIYTGLKEQNPNSAVTLESVKRMLEKEQEEKVDKLIRRRAIAIVSRDLGGDVSQATIEKMVEAEVKALKEEQAERKKRELLAYRKLLDE